ncbi:MAG: hypothetical protein E2598_12760 [Sphingobium sp.]|nr:hypothetical protein [Sphingobium sp.]
MAGLHHSVEHLEKVLTMLRQSLDHKDAAAIMLATREVGVAIDAVRARQSEVISPEIRSRLEAMVPMIENARMRVNVAADDVRRRIDHLAQQGVEQASSLYGRR